jgi:ParB family chromosome partitioning protein
VPIPPEAPRTSADRILQIDIDRIQPNRQQPRQTFDEEQLAELAASIRRDGVLQPVVVRTAAGGNFELIAGERRWRAAQIAGLLKVPAVIREFEDDRLLEVALVENLQREDLNAIDAAHAFRTLCDDLGLTQEEVAQRVGKQRATVANLLRLLHLPPQIQDHVKSGRLSTGHAKALLSIGSPRLQREAAERIVEQGLSVRQAESLAARLVGPAEASTRPATVAPARDPNVVAAEEILQRSLGTKVSIHQDRKGRGRIEVHFYSEEELDRVFQLLRHAGRAG